MRLSHPATRTLHTSKSLFIEKAEQGMHAIKGRFQGSVAVLAKIGMPSLV